LKQGHRRHGKTMLRAAYDHHVFGTQPQAATCEMTRHDRPLVLSTAVRQILQEGFQITGGGQPAQCAAQQIHLTWQRWIVEVEVGNAIGHSVLVDPQTARQ
jgi:hypothetical protein